MKKQGVMIHLLSRQHSDATNGLMKSISNDTKTYILQIQGVPESYVMVNGESQKDSSMRMLRLRILTKMSY